MTIPGTEAIKQAVSVLRNGGVIAMPSDTLYALCAAASDAEAVQRGFDIKGLASDRPLPWFVSILAMAEQIGVFVNQQVGYQSEGLAAGSTIGVRVPDNQIALSVIEGVGDAVTGTSANLGGGSDPVSADDVRRQIGDRLDLILVSGSTEHGVGSTCSSEEVRILRQGAIAEDDITRELEA